MREHGNDVNGNEGDSNPLTDGILSSGGTTATYHQKNILPTGDFVNMNTTPWKWVILGDYTDWHSTHDRCVKKSEWYEWLAWRSDGRLIGHVTFCLMLYNHKRKIALQGQDEVALHTDDIDTTIKAEEFLNEWDNEWGIDIYVSHPKYSRVPLFIYLPYHGK
eukprot:3898987-Ditylum_brightwellii.AAC.1